jgi:hypothetical protein
MSRFLEKAGHDLPALGREHVFRELAADEGAHLMASIKGKLVHQVGTWVEPRGPRHDLGEIDEVRVELQQACRLFVSIRPGPQGSCG